MKTVLTDDAIHHVWHCYVMPAWKCQLC